MTRRIYLDNAATTAPDERVLAEMMRFFREDYGNASSVHHFGQVARAATDRSRHQVAEFLGARPNEIVFTSGGTESNNLAIKGAVRASGKSGGHVVVSSIEHPSVRAVCDSLSESGVDVTEAGVGSSGVVDPGEVGRAIRDDTFLVSIMTANNEIGTIQPVKEIGHIVAWQRKKGQQILFHTDAVQAAGKLRIDVDAIGCDLLSISGHKMYAPKGSGALFVRRGVKLYPQMIGGHQERDRRAGTENVAQIVALGKACEIAEEERVDNAAQLSGLLRRFEEGLQSSVSQITINGRGASRLPNISNVSFRYVDGEALLINLDMRGIAVSTGSACSSGSLEASQAVAALGVGEDSAREAVRFSFGRSNTAEEVAEVLEVLPEAVRSLRRLSPEFRSASGAQV